MVTCPSCGESNPERFRLCGYCGTALAVSLPAHEVRKTVTILFSDLKGSTNLGEALDPESLREVMTRYFEAMSAELERHGGTIEKYIGDAIMAVFGLPTVHEDDALRAVRAAVGMQRALATLNEDLERRWGVRLTNRTGVNTGEVVAGDPETGQRLVTGDAVNTAARLEQAAPADGILLGELTHRLVRDAVEVESVEPLELKGKAERVPAFRLVTVHGAIHEGTARREDAPLVGREDELGRLRDLYRAAVDDGTPRAVTIIGEAGVGKSRLTRALLDEVAAEADVLRGRCLPYGEGITFWPMLEVVRTAADIREDDPPELARSKLLGLVDDREVAVRVGSMAGLVPVQFPLAELFWGARKMLELLAARRPVVLVIDDIHWAEPAFLDFIDHVLDEGDGALLVTCTARHDLLDRRPDWAGRERASTVELAPLSDDDATRITENLLGSAVLPADVTARIVRAAEGNPLFVEQLLTMLLESGALRFDDGRWVRSDESAEIPVPPTIQALLAARLDALPREEQAVVEPAAVVGLEFAEAAVTELVPDGLRPYVPDRLASLTRKQLVRPDATSVWADHRFGHILIRDAAYARLLKRSRATLHERFVAWADRVNAERGRTVEFEEILGYHLEQAYRYLADLGPIDEHGEAVGADAAARLASAGRRALARGDMHAAANLLGRASGMLGPDRRERLELLPLLGEAHMELGEFDAARTAVDEAIAAAEAMFDDRLRAAGLLIRMLIRLYSAEPGDWSRAALEAVEVVIPILEREGADAELATAWRLVGYVHGVACRYGEAAAAVARSMEHARRAGDTRMIARNASAVAMTAVYGPTPADRAIEQCEQILDEGLADREAEALVLCSVAQLRAMRGEVDVARSLYRRARELLRELGSGVVAASTALDLARVELLAGSPEIAEREMLPDFEFLQRAGETYVLSTMAALLARIARAQGADDVALIRTQTAERLAAEDDIEAQALWRSVRGPLVARRGQLAEAEALARSGLELARRTDAPLLQADAIVDLADVVILAGRPGEARALLDEAAALYRAKGDTVSAVRTSRLLAGLAAARSLEIA